MSPVSPVTMRGPPDGAAGPDHHGLVVAEQGIPIPENNLAGPAAVESVIWDLDDMGEIDDKIAPLMEKVNPSRRPNSRRPSAA